MQCIQGKGKARPLRQLEKNPRFHIAYRQLGVEWNIQPETLEQLEHATYVMLWQGQESSADVVRTSYFTICLARIRSSPPYKGDLARLPHCQFALKPHIQCGNHRTALY